MQSSFIIVIRGSRAYIAYIATEGKYPADDSVLGRALFEEVALFVQEPAILALGVEVPFSLLSFFFQLVHGISQYNNTFFDVVPSLTNVVGPTLILVQEQLLLENEKTYRGLYDAHT